MTTAVSFSSSDQPAPFDFGPLLNSWKRSLKSRNVAEQTLKVYGTAGERMRRYILTYKPPEPDALPAPETLDAVHREHLEAWITHEIETTSASSANVRFRPMKTFFNWLVDEEELDRSPMRSMRAPTPGEKEVPVISDNALKALITVCSGKDFASRRDLAIIMLFIDTGVRLTELTARSIGDIDLDLQVLRVLGKSNRERAVPIGRTAATAVDRYLRALSKHGCSTEPDAPLWVGVKSKAPFTIWGVGTMLERRAEEAGLGHIHPHQFRHTFAHLWKVNGGNEDDLMRITGWRSRQMLARYAASAGAERARNAHKNLSPGDNLK
ncbi:tyrosine-type recombinase/integrase [Streptacidiphilus carbonis]|uniref:tyrosine-type recombinase/integrase n=1 Tax=Streptacidiphilus carbonis TaxID=105422 RepID=UPI0005AA4A4E|nr:tyrosine-type recombinase/integrase [Streptacidiphilus carbonis]